MTVPGARTPSFLVRWAMVGLAAIGTLTACAGSKPVATRAEPATTTAPAAAPTTSADTSTSASLAPLGTAPPTSTTTTQPTTTTAPEPPPSTSQATDPPTTAAPAALTPATAAQAAAAPSPAPPGPPSEPFVFEVSAIGGDVQARMVPTSWRPGCPVPLEELRYLRVSYWGFDNAAHVGELVVHSSAVEVMRGVFTRLYNARFPIRQMRLVDDYGGDDFTSIEADNTSAFNCRQATGSSHWSQHAYGLAIDVNPIENPYVYSNGTSDHPASAPYLDRSTIRPGMAIEGGMLVAAFDAEGWGWGGRWGGPIDFQHFSSNGR